MSKASRRSLSKYAADQLLAGAKVGILSKKLAAVLVESSRAAEQRLLIDDILWELEQRGELTVAGVTSAHEISTNLRRQLEKQLATATKVKAVVLETEVDKRLLGGLRVRTATRTWDSSLATKLSELKEAF